MNAPAAPVPDTIGLPPLGLPMPRRLWAAAAIWAAISMSVVDTAIANVALPTIARDLGASPVASIWVVNAYQIAITMALLPAAALGEKLGYRRVYGWGLALFVAASLLCSLSRSLPMLAAARFLQGFGAAGIMGINGALVRFTYPEDKLARGIGYNALVVAIASAAGPSIAAAILAFASWPWLFGVNLVPGLIALVIGMRCLPATPPSGRRLDMGSAAINALSFGALFLGLSEMARGAVDARTMAEVAGGILLAVWLVIRERGNPAPLFPVDLMRMPMLRLSYAASACAFAAQMAVFVALPFYFQQALHLGHVATGLLITPWPVAVAFTAPIAGRLFDRFPAAVLATSGMAIMAAGLGLLALLSPDSSDLSIIWRMALCGVGFGLFQTPNNRTMLGTAPRQRSGAAAGMQATMRLVGQTVGAVLVAGLFHLLPGDYRAILLAACLLAFASALFSAGRARRSAKA
jgi:DHA2 family multidrug resistance protein-like MFS transporter